MTPVSEASIPARLSSVIRRHPDRIAVRADGAEWSYAELEVRSATVAARVLNLVGDSQAPVALLMEHGVPMIAAVLGVLRAGRMYVGLDPVQPEHRLRSMLVDCNPCLVLTDPLTAELARMAAPTGVRAEVLEIRGTGAAAPKILPEVAAQAGAWLTYTSGSTGVPKGVWRNHASVIHHAEVYARLIGVQPDDRFTLLTSLGLAASATPLFTALLHGATICPFDVRARGAMRLGQWLSQEKITVAHAVPTIFRRLLRSLPTGKGFGDLRVVRLGGEAVQRSDVEALRRSTPGDCVLMHALSSTETGLIAALLLEMRAPLPEGRLTVGQLVEGVDVVLLDAAGQPVATGGEGRLVVKSAALAEGYWGRPEETRASFRPDPADPSRRQFASGDLARFRPDGGLEHLGRLDEQVKISGQRVDLAEVESVLTEVDGVQDAAVVAVSEGEASPSLVACVVAEPTTALTAQSCRQSLTSLLPSFMVPRQIRFRPSLPYTRAGKLDRQALTQGLEANSGASRPTARPMPRDDIEKQIGRIWESALGIASIGRKENVFDLGADSLHALEIVARVNDTFEVELPPAALVEDSTVESLAARVASKTIRRSGSALIGLRTAESGLPLFLVPGGHGHVASFGRVVRHLPNQPVYGFQAPGLEGECWPRTSIPSIARYYVQEVLAGGYAGPLLLVGTCVGGIIAFEMARQLVAQGCQVGMLVLIEAKHPDHGGRDAPLRQQFQDAVRDGFRRFRWRLIRSVGLGRSRSWLPAYRRFVGQMYGRARRRYRPGFYAGEVSFVLAGEEADGGADDSRLQMSRHAARSQSVVLPYNSAGLFASTGAMDLARVLKVWMKS